MCSSCRAHYGSVCYNVVIAVGVCGGVQFTRYAVKMHGCVQDTLFCTCTSVLFLFVFCSVCALSCRNKNATRHLFGVSFNYDKVSDSLLQVADSYQADMNIRCAQPTGCSGSARHSRISTASSAVYVTQRNLSIQQLLLLQQAYQSDQLHAPPACTSTVTRLPRAVDLLAVM